MSNILKKFTLFYGLSFILILIDQLTKKIAREFLSGEKPYSIIDNVLEFTYVENRGAAFGILQNKQILFYILTVIVLIILVVYINRIVLNEHNILKFIIAILIFSGAIGNFIDRIKNKYVVDFIYFKLIDFPVFNFADIYITIACIILIISMFTVYKNEV